MIWLPAGLSAAVLLVIAITFIWLSEQLDVQSQFLAHILEPAKQKLTGFQLSFLDEVAVGRSFLLRPTPEGLTRLQAIHTRTEHILDGLDTNASRIGPQFARGLASLHEQFAVWRAAPDTVLSGRVSFEEFINRLPRQEGLSGSVVSQAAQLDSAVSLQTQSQVLQMRRLERRRILLLGALFPLAVLGTVLTAWFGRRVMQSQRAVLRTAAFEAMLRDSMAALTGAEILPVALNRIASNAMRLAAADCALIEHADDVRGNVQIAAAVGAGAPATGIQIPFGKSLTDALVRAGAPALSLDLATYSDRDLLAQWKNGHGIAIPLQEGGNVDGALVLLSRSGLDTRAETVARLHSLGAWATVAVRRQQLAARLELERARLEAVISEVPVGLVLADAPSGHIISINRKAVELWGSPPDPRLAIEEYSEWKVYRPDGQPYATQERPLARTILTGEVVQGEEAQVKRPDGGRSIVRINSAPIRDSHGAIAAGVSAIVDITDERKREERSRFLDDISHQLASTLDYEATIQAALQLLVPRVADAASIHHREGDVLVRRWDTSGTDPQFDQKFRAMLRDYPLQLPSAHPVAVAVRTGRAQLHEVVDETLLKTIARNEKEFKKLQELGLQSAMTVPLSVRGKHIGAMQFVLIHKSRRYSLSDLALAEEVTRRVALAIDNAHLFQSVNNNAAVSSFLSEAALAVSGSLEHDEVLRRVTRLAVPFLADFSLAYVQDGSGHLRHVASAHQDPSKALLLAEAAERCVPDAKSPASTIVRALNTGQPVLIENVTAEVLDAQGFAPKARELVDALAPASSMTIPLVARDATIGAVVFVSTSREHRYGSRDVKVAQALAGRAALATQNALLYREMHDALSTRDEVLAIVSHDLRDPLHTIAMSAQLLTDVPGDQAQHRKHLQIIVRAKARMERLIQDLVDVVRIKNGKTLGIEPRREGPSPLVREACEQFVESAREKNVRLEWGATNDMPDVMVDHGRIIQVLSNLIGNALKFTPAGGRIDVRLHRESKKAVRVTVSDSGTGIAAENLPRIFDAFWQAPRAARLGSGLGLAISRGIVQQHGGRIWAESREGIGSTFHFTLPTAETEKELAAAA
jgi:PAS domain S-box-containing protein